MNGFFLQVSILFSATMSNLFPRFFLSFITLSTLLPSFCSSWCPQHYMPQSNSQFQPKTNKFWEFEEKSNTWVKVKLPYDLISCINNNCTKVGSIDGRTSPDEKENIVQNPNKKNKGKKKKKKRGGGDEEELMKEESILLPLRKRVSMIKMSETSIWITGESGSIYERFWNGLQWVIVPHDLPVSVSAVSVFIVNQTVLALSEAGNLFQLKLGENSQPLWVDCTPSLDYITRKQMEKVELKSGVATHDRMSIYFCTKDGWLLELSEIELPRWINHGRPPGANVAAIVDAAATIRSQLIFTVSSSGDLYEFDRHSRPLWKKHIWSEGSAAEDSALTPSTGCSLHGASNSVSLFLLTKGGNLVERRLHHRKWKWIIHGCPKNHRLTSITTPIPQNEPTLFFTTSVGTIFEYHIPKHGEESQVEEYWVNHMHPPHAKAARGITGVQLQVGRIIFPLDDGRLGELHLSGIGGESIGPSPSPQLNTRRKTSIKTYIWSILDAPESEGWNAEYCTEQHGPSNCITGVLLDDLETSRSMSRRRKEYYVSLGESGSSSCSSSTQDYIMPDNWINTNFRLRVMHGGTSFFLITEGGLTFEYLNADNAWFWLRHDYSTRTGIGMKGAVGNYNGSLFLIDEHMNLLVRERSSKELAWINCTAMKKGRHVIGGPPWDLEPGKARKVTAEDALFFVSKTGRLLQLTVALKKYKWKDCRTPPNIKIASIVDQEILRENLVFVIGKNGKLYQYNKITELWHGHYQSQHLVLSRLPGTAMRGSLLSLTGSLFMLSEDGRLIEYHWNSFDGWNWVEHGIACIGVTLVGSTGPCFGGNKLFVIGSDGKVYLRYYDQGTWKWGDCGFPYIGGRDGKKQVCIAADFSGNSHQESPHSVSNNCDSKVAPTRPIPFTDDSVIFEMRDGRLAELKEIEEGIWVWWRTIGTPTSLCNLNYWTAIAAA